MLENNSNNLRLLKALSFNNPFNPYKNPYMKLLLAPLLMMKLSSLR